MDNKPANIDAYIANCPEAVREALQAVRIAIQTAAPTAEETISYGMPTFLLHGILVHFAAFKNHIGLYATPTGHEAFAADLSQYKHGKGSVQFPLDQPMPLDLIKRIVQFRAAENLAKTNHKPKNQKSTH